MNGLVTSFWVQAYLTRLRLQDIQAFIVAHGDDTAGALLIKINTLDGRAAAMQRGFDVTSGARTWVELVAGDEGEVDQAITRQRAFDPDLWVVEVEDRQGRHHVAQCAGLYYEHPLGCRKMVAGRHHKAAPAARTAFFRREISWRRILSADQSSIARQYGL